ncbi:MAG: hypothetical protein AAGF83_19275 [Cyanobacteria bacterium P01_G01_bin.67]
MTTNPQKQRISITVDTQLLQEVDKLTKNRSAAVEAGLKLWRKQQIEKQLRDFYQNRSETDELFEQEWTDATQEQAALAWSESEG